MPPFEIEKLIAAIMAVALLSLIKEEEKTVEKAIEHYQACLEALQAL